MNHKVRALTTEAVAYPRPPCGRGSSRICDRNTVETFESQAKGCIHILIANQHPIYGDGLRALLEKQSDFKIVGVAPDITATVKMSREQTPDVLLLDVNGTGYGAGKADEMSVLDEIQSLRIHVRPLLLASTLSGLDIMQALMLGARGVVLKTSTVQALVDGIRAVMFGQYWIGEDMGTSMKEALREHTRSFGVSVRHSAFGLTPREIQIISTVVAGYSNAEIARRYALSEQTVKHHLSSIFDKVGVFSRLELALFAIHHHLAGEDS